MDERRRRIGLNEATFREINDEEEVMARTDTGALEAASRRACR